MRAGCGPRRFRRHCAARLAPGRRGRRAPTQLGPEAAL